MLSNLLTALLLTIVIEVFFALIFGFRDKYAILSVVFINFITNLLLNYLLLAGGYFFDIYLNFTSFLLLEILIILFEWAALFFVLRRSPRKLFALSVVMNFCSASIGFVIMRIISYFPNF